MVNMDSGELRTNVFLKNLVKLKLPLLIKIKTHIFWLLYYLLSRKQHTNIYSYYIYTDNKYIAIHICIILWLTIQVQ